MNTEGDFSLHRTKKKLKVVDRKSNKSVTEYTLETLFMDAFNFMWDKTNGVTAPDQIWYAQPSDSWMKNPHYSFVVVDGSNNRVVKMGTRPDAYRLDVQRHLAVDMDLAFEFDGVLAKKIKTATVTESVDDYFRYQRLFNLGEKLKDIAAGRLNYVSVCAFDPDNLLSDKQSRTLIFKPAEASSIFNFNFASTLVPRLLAWLRYNYHNYITHNELGSSLLLKDSKLIKLATTKERREISATQKLSITLDYFSAIPGLTSPLLKVREKFDVLEPSAYCDTAKLNLIGTTSYDVFTTEYSLVSPEKRSKRDLVETGSYNVLVYHASLDRRGDNITGFEVVGRKAILYGSSDKEGVVAKDNWSGVFCTLEVNKYEKPKNVGGLKGQKLTHALGVTKKRYITLSPVDLNKPEDIFLDRQKKGEGSAFRMGTDDKYKPQKDFNTPPNDKGCRYYTSFPSKNEILVMVVSNAFSSTWFKPSYFYYVSEVFLFVKDGFHDVESVIKTTDVPHVFDTIAAVNAYSSTSVDTESTSITGKMKLNTNMNWDASAEYSIDGDLMSHVEGAELFFSNNNRKNCKEYKMKTKVTDSG